ncbi:MAG: type II toxin-antitoxin system RelE family toxin [Candidatus Micrarchaeia archaeon]
MFSPDYSNDILRAFKKIKKKDAAFYGRVRDKMEQILLNPEHYKPMKNVLKGLCRTQIGPFVLLFEVLAEEKIVKFVKFEHHDKVYK